MADQNQHPARREARFIAFASSYFEATLPASEIAAGRRWTICASKSIVPKPLSVAPWKTASIAAVNIKTRGRAALSLLVEGHRTARQLQCSPWHSAIDARDLRRAGFTENDLRWLVCRGFVEQAREVTARDEVQRAFVLTRGLKFGKRTCFVLSPTGVNFACGEAQAN